MEMVVPILAAALGAAAGAFSPDVSEAVCRYKYRRREKSLSPDPRFLAPGVRLLCGALCAAGWGYLSLRAPALPAVLAGLAWYLALLLGVIDARVRLVPNELLLALVLAGGALRVLTDGWKSLGSSAFCLLALMVVFLLAAKLVGGLWCVGAGDVKLAGALGFVLGYPAVLAGVLAMALSMGLFCALGLALKKLSKTAMIPMAPFLSLGLMAGLVAMFLS
jgi:prepilin signal peptidase PulO-like enzyme (type II secretory pathway)